MFATNSCLFDEFLFLAGITCNNLPWKIELSNSTMALHNQPEILSNDLHKEEKYPSKGKNLKQIL